MRVVRVFSSVIFLIASPSIGDTISLQDALKRGSKNSTQVESAHIAVMGLKNAQNYWGFIHNPELSIEIENFLGSGDYSWFKSAEITYSLSQTFELGRKRAQRLAVLDQELKLAKLFELEKRLDLIKDLSIAHAEAVYCQERLKSVSEQKDLAEDLYKEVTSRVSHAREPLVQETKASIALFSARFDYEKAVRDLSVAKQALANLWNGHEESYALDPEAFFHISQPLMEQQAEEMLPKNPSIQMAEARIAEALAQYNLESSLKMVDLTFDIGVKHHLDQHNFALVAGLTLPLPFFNRNQIPIEKAHVLVERAKVDAKTDKLKLVLSLHEWLKNIENAYGNAQTLKTSIIPMAQKSFALSREGYRSGKTPYYEVLDSQRTLSLVNEQYLSALKEYHVANAQIERLIAKHSDHQLVVEGGKHEE